MKGGSSSKLRVKRLPFTLISLICLTFAIWVWEKAPLLTSFLPPSDEYDMRSSVLSLVAPSRTSSVTHTIEKHRKPSTFEVSLDSSINEVPSESTTEDEISTTVKSEDLERGPGKEAISSEETKDVGRLKLINSECNYAKGKWVADSRRPLYSGLGCKQWLSEMWSCRLNQRTDSSYENYRWQPKDCEMPEFDGSRFLRRMQHRTIALVGDSLGRQQFQSLMCMVTGGKEYLEVEDIGKQYGLVKAPGAKRPDGWAYRFTRTNTTILYYWSASLCELEAINRTDPSTSYAMHLDRPATFLKQYLHRFDVLVLNTGHHWNRGKLNGNRWIMYVNGMPNTDKKIAVIWNAKNLTVHSVARWLDSQFPKYPPESENLGFIEVDLVVSRMRGRSYSYSPSPPRHYHRRGRSPSPRGRYGGGGSRDMPTSLLVRNLRHGCKPEDLRKPFGQFGPLKDIYLPRDYYTGEPRGFGFVQYVDPADAAEAKYQMDRQILFGRELTVVFAEENRKKPSDMRARERTSRHDQRSPRPSRSARYSRSRSPRYSRSPPPRRGRSPRGHGYHSPLPRRHSYSQSPPKKHIYSPSPRQRDYSRSVSPDDKRGRRERSYSQSPVDRRPRSRSPYEEEEEGRERSRSVSR